MHSENDDLTVSIFSIVPFNSQDANDDGQVRLLSGNDAVALNERTIVRFIGPISSRGAIYRLNWAPQFETVSHFGATWRLHPRGVCVDWLRLA